MDLRKAKCEQCGEKWEYHPRMTDLLHQHFCSLDCGREFFGEPQTDKDGLEYLIRQHEFGRSIDNL